MATKKVTIFFLPDGTNRVRQLSFPRYLLFFIVLCLASSAAYLCWIIGDYQTMKARMDRLAGLQKENEHHKTQFYHLTQRIDDIAKKMCELKEFDRELKGMVNLETGEDSTPLRGMGGSDPALLRPNYSMVKTHKDLVRLMHRSLDQVDVEILADKQYKAEIQKFLENQKKLLAYTPSIWPIKGWLSSRFGYRTSPFTGEKEFHRGIDIAARRNAPIIAPADGVVASVGKEYGYGKVLSIRHGHGVVTRYAHLNKAVVKKGQFVKRGETVALVGNTGRSTGTHLHYEVHLNGVPVNPLRYIKK